MTWNLFRFTFGPKFSKQNLAKVVGLTPAAASEMYYNIITFAAFYLFCIKKEVCNYLKIVFYGEPGNSKPYIAQSIYFFALSYIIDF